LVASHKVFSHTVPATSSPLFTTFVASHTALFHKFSTAFHIFVKVELNLPNNPDSSILTGVVVV
jgi:hypothetical protein